jgi:hypothetical protein
MMAYGTRFERNGISSGLRRITARYLRLDHYHAVLLLTLMIVSCWSVGRDVRLEDFAPFLSDSGAAWSCRHCPRAWISCRSTSC